MVIAVFSMQSLAKLEFTTVTNAFYVTQRLGHWGRCQYEMDKEIKIETLYQIYWITGNTNLQLL